MDRRLCIEVGKRESFFPLSDNLAHGLFEMSVRCLSGIIDFDRFPPSGHFVN